MKILINQNNGAVLTIDKYMRSEDKVVLTKYDNGVMYKLGIPIEANPNKSVVSSNTIVPIELMNPPDYEVWMCEESCRLEYPAYNLVARNNYNWVYSKGTTNINTVVRVHIPFEVAGQSSANENSLYAWMEAVKAQKAFRTNGKYAFVQYLEDLSTQDRTMLESYAGSGVVIDDRLFTLTFSVKQNGIAVEGARIVIEGELPIITNNLGECSIEKPKGVYNYTCWYPDNYERAGYVTIVRTNKTENVNS